MKIQIQKDLLVDALSKVEKPIGKSSTPILQGIYIEATSDCLKFVGSGDEQTISVELNVDESITVEGEGKIVITKNTIDVVKKLRTDIVEITVNLENFQYLIKAGKSKFNFSGYDATEYVQFTSPTDEPILELTFEELKEISNKLGFAASTNEARPALQGINILGSASLNQVRLVATNSHILSQMVISKELSEDFSLIPKARSIADALKVFNTSDNIQLFVTTTDLILKSENVTVRTRLLETNYPPTDRLIMKEFMAVLEVDKAEFLYALEQIEIVGNNGGNPIAATFSLNENNVKIENNTTEIGKAEIEMPIEQIQKNTDDIEIKFAFDVKYMINLVKATDGNIKICYIDAARPISILGTESTGEYKLILPIRLR